MKEFRLIDKPIGEIVKHEDFHMHRKIFTSKDRMEVFAFVVNRPQYAKRCDALSVITFSDTSITIYSYPEWVKKEC